VSASPEGAFKVWDLGKKWKTLPSYRHSNKVNSHSNKITSLAILPDGQRVVSSSSDTTIKLWDLESGKCLRTFEGHADQVMLLALTSNRCAVSGSLDETLKLWDLESGECLKTFDGYACDDCALWGSGVNSLTVLLEGKRVVATSSNSLIILNMDACEVLHKHTSGRSTSRFCRVFPDRRHILWVSNSNLQIWNTETGQIISTTDIRDYLKNPIDVELLSEGDKAIIAYRGPSPYGSIVICDLKTGHRGHIKTDNGGYVDQIKLFANDRRIALATTSDGYRTVLNASIYVWELDDLFNRGHPICQFVGHSGPITYMSITANGHWVVSAGLDKRLKVWEAESGEEIASFYGESSFVCCAIKERGLITNASIQDNLKDDDFIIVAGEESGRIHFLKLEEPN